MNSTSDRLPMNDTTCRALLPSDKERLRPLYPNDERLMETTTQVESEISDLTRRAEESEGYAYSLELESGSLIAEVSDYARELRTLHDSINSYINAESAEGSRETRIKMIEAKLNVGGFLRSRNKF